MIDLRLFRLPTFNAALVVNFLAIFVAVGYFLFVAQYLQLVAGLSPLQAGLLSLPSAIGVHRRVAGGAADRPARPARVPHQRRAGPRRRSGLVLLTQVGTSNGLLPLVVASVVISLGLAPVFGLTTELIVGSAPPERAGAASGISETGAELGGALGIAILGSIGVAIYRGRLAPGPARRPSARGGDRCAGHARRRGRLSQAACPAGLPINLLGAARTAFVDGMHVAAGIAGVIGLGLAVFAFVSLRDREMAPAEPEPICVEPTMLDEPVLNPLAKPARECF